MDFKVDHAVPGVEHTATQEVLKRAYRKLARKYHPDVGNAPDAEARFEDIAEAHEAHEALNDAEKRVAHDDFGKRHKNGEAFSPARGSDRSFEFSGRGPGAAGGDGKFGQSEFFDSLSGHRAAGAPGRGAQRAQGPVTGEDHHAEVGTGLPDSNRGGQRNVLMRWPQPDASGRTAVQERRLGVSTPKSIRNGQHLRLAGQGEPAQSGGPARSSAGRKRRLKGKRLPITLPGDLYAVLQMAPLPADTEPAQSGYRKRENALAGSQPRPTLET